ncbi:SOS response-associated peptidase [Paraurantiacibacter namhicola]|uniref:Abasic site processing protein n=1 Tax=Paraurantiacibacter namhicola TaxID=645517 RepID=A0A1C7D6K9_9SPHN|nr:SOS response-associated peptidase family protein [Paraurantiacibacter namhicola]ANU07094.1 hypothetical protein A6F65_00774 [Paraurantiacibacter namhicola]
MCNLYRMANSAAEVANFFELVAATGSNVPGHVYPGTPGLVIVDGTVTSMTWGFPFAQVSKKTGKPLKPKPVNNARTDKLKSFFWRQSFEQRRCLIPLEAFAEAEGQRGAMTRTWMSMPGANMFTVAGIHRETDEWGAAYSMVMTDANAQMSAIHNRMPVILATAEARKIWQEGSPADAFDLCRPFEGELHIDRTDQRWAG